MCPHMFSICPGPCMQGATTHEPPVPLCLSLLPRVLLACPLADPWAELVRVTCSPIAPQKTGQNQKYVCKKAGNFIEFFPVEQRSGEIRAARSGGKGSQSRGKSEERPPREGGGPGPGSGVTELPRSLPLSCRTLPLSPPLGAEERGGRERAGRPGSSKADEG